MRSQVTAIATASVFAVLVITSIVLVLVQRGVLTDNLEEGIQSRAVDISSLARTHQARTPLAGFGDDDAVAQVVDDDGVVIASTTNASGLAPIAGPPRGERAWHTLHDLSVDDSAFRVLSVRVEGGDRGQVVHVGATLGDVHQSTSLLARSLALGVPLVTAMFGILVWLLVGRTLRPVEAIRSEVSAIGGRDLHRRVPDPGTDDEIGRLASTMNAMLERVEDAAARQQRFVADASHELRSPLTRMRAELEVDLAHPGEADEAATHRSVLDEAVGLERLVEDLLLLARSDAGAVDERHQMVDLDDIVARMARRARAAGFEVDVRDVVPVQVPGDGRQLERALGNVVDNAVRHGRRKLTLTLAGHDGHAEVAVADDGPGVPVEHQERIFERFTRVDDARSTASGGTGLGLAIARDVIHRHGGTIAIDPDHSPGARVVMRLPVG